MVSGTGVLQVYWDHARIESVITEYDRDTVDVDFQHRFQFGDRHEVVWGAGWRGVYDTLGDAELITSERRDRSHNLVSAFLQDEIQIVPDRLALTIGSKIEYNDYTGAEYQPTARLTWQPTEKSTAWFAYTRAVRTPSRVENDFAMNVAGTPGGFVVFRGDEDIESEYLDAFELGYRTVVAEHVVVDLATYYNRYDRLRTFELVGADFVTDNRMQGEAYGVEAAVTWDVCPCWRLLSAYTFTQLNSNLDDDSADWGGSLGEENEFPRHLFYVQSTWQLRKNIELGLSVRYADNFRSEELDRYIESNAHLAWRPSESLELALNIRNLLDNHRPEHGPQHVVQDQTTEVRRSCTLRATYRF